MSNWLSWLFIVLSFSFFLADVVIITMWIVKSGKINKKRDMSVNILTGKRTMIAAVILLVSVWLLRFVIGAYGLTEPTDSIPSMPLHEQVFNSFVHALQTFSMDEDYTEYIEHGKKLMAHLNCGDFAVTVFGLYASLLNVLAPIVGGAFIFEILAEFFPKLYYYFSLLFKSKTRYYFTALNEQSLALAKSIVTSGEEKNGILIFTDAYSDDEDEKSSELILSAKALGAICLKDDLLHIKLKRRGKKKMYIFLSDREESENLQTLSQLLSMPDQHILQGAEISVFGTDKKQSYIEDEVIYIHNRGSSKYEKAGKEIVPDIVPVNGIRNMAQQLFCKLPLFESLYGKAADDQQINLTIIGSGVIGTEMFLNAYWFGQIANVSLNITVVSVDESEEEFISRINSINPDIMATSKAGHNILNAYIGDDRTPVKQPKYFNFRYVQEDILDCDLSYVPKDETGNYYFPLRDTDYFVVAVGSDAKNFRIADRLRQKIAYYHLNEARRKKTIISYVIYNSALCNTLNASSRQNHISDAKANEFDIYMHAFGSMEEIYSVENILRNNLMFNAESIDKQYRSHQNRDELMLSIKERRYYNTRASIARSLQIRYKAFAAGIIEPTLFVSTDDEQYQRLLTQAELHFIEQVNKVWSYPEYASKSNALAWMEHRRWNAFMRINGFRCPENMAKYIELNSDVHCLADKHDKAYQFLFIKLHPCVVESDIRSYPGIKSKDNAKKQDCPNQLGPDELDILFEKLGTDYKVYDYPEEDAKQDEKDAGKKTEKKCCFKKFYVKSDKKGDNP